MFREIRSVVQCKLQTKLVELQQINYFENKIMCLFSKPVPLTNLNLYKSCYILKDAVVIVNNILMFNYFFPQKTTFWSISNCPTFCNEN